MLLIFFYRGLALGLFWVMELGLNYLTILSPLTGLLKQKEVFRFFRLFFSLLFLVLTFFPVQLTFSVDLSFFEEVWLFFFFFLFLFLFFGFYLLNKSC